MAESTLSLTFEDLGRSTAFYMGWGRKATTGEGLTAAQAANVEAANKEGYRRFLAEWDWAFLKPRLTLTLWPTVTGTATAGLTTTVTATTAKFYPTMIGHSIVFTAGSTYTITGYTSSTVITVNTTAVADSSKAFTITADGLYRMPDDFGGIDSTYISFAANSNDDRVITLTSEPLVVDSWQYSTAVGRPAMAGIRPVAIGTTGQRFNLVVSYIPDQEYPVNFRYNVIPDALTAGLYPYGGMQHASTIRACCLAAAEQMFNQPQQIEEAAALRALARSKDTDRRINRSERLGTSVEREYANSGSWGPYGRCVGGTAYGVDYG